MQLDSVLECPSDNADNTHFSSKCQIEPRGNINININKNAYAGPHTAVGWNIYSPNLKKNNWYLFEMLRFSRR